MLIKLRKDGKEIEVAEGDSAETLKALGWSVAGISVDGDRLAKVMPGNDCTRLASTALEKLAEIDRRLAAIERTDASRRPIHLADA